MGSFSVVSSTSRVAPLARVSRARASRFSAGLAPFAGSRSASRRRVVVRAAPGPEPDDVQRTAREVREAAREAAREVDELLRRYDELRDDVHLTPDARSNVVVAGSSSSVTSSSTTRALRGTDPDNEGNVADENQPAYRERWGGSDDEDDAVAAAGGAPSRVRPPDPDPDPDAFAARYTDEDIARVQIDGLTHAAVFDEAASRIDRETAAADLRRRDPEFASLRHVGVPGARPPHVALPSDPKSKACICRYAYDRDELERAGEEYASEGVDPAEASSLNREARDATLEELLPATVRDSCRGANPGYSRTVLLQAFDWTSSKTGDAGWWRRLRAMAGDLASAGITHAWLPPPSQSASPEGYLPGKLFNLDRSAYGDESELIALCEALTDVGIVPVCDVVINHRTADDVGPEGVYNVYDDLDPDGEPVSWGSWAITCDDPTFRGRGGPDSGENYGPAPDLDHANPELRATLARWMAFLRDEIGFGGFRFDFVRGYAPEYVEEYVRATFGGGHVSKPPTAFNVGENWVDMRWEGSTLSYDQDGPRRTLVDWIGATHGVCAAFDFPAKGILQRAVQHTEYWRLADPANRPPGLLGWVPERAVTFTDNHDTGYPQNHWPFPEDRQALGYAYVLTHPGVPCVYGPHLWDAANHPEWDSGGANLGKVIRALLAARRRADVRAESSVRILVAEADLYVARVANRLVVKLGPRFETPPELLPREPEWTLTACGEDWAVWERAEHVSDEAEEESRAAEAAARLFADAEPRDVLLGGALDGERDPPSIGSFYAGFRDEDDARDEMDEDEEEDT